MALELEDKVRSIAKDLGFDECRFSVARKATHANQFQAWLDDGQNGDMKWMERSPERRKDPRLLLEEARTVIVLAINYYPSRSDPRSKDKLGRFAKYAWGEDYHLVVDKKLKAFASALEELGGEQRFYVDYGRYLNVISQLIRVLVGTVKVLYRFIRALELGSFWLSWSQR